MRSFSCALPSCPWQTDVWILAKERLDLFNLDIADSLRPLKTIAALIQLQPDWPILQRKLADVSANLGLIAPVGKGKGPKVRACCCAL